MFSRQLIEAQEEERRRIALELHDQIGQVLTVVKINLPSVLRLFPGPETARYIKDNTDLVDEALRLVRDLSIDLRPLLLDDLGLVTALRWYIERYAERTGVVADFHVDLPSSDHRFSRDIETACFRIVQEALTNVGRHAQTKEVSIQVTGDKSDLFLRVKDDGIGFDLNLLRTRPPRATTLGLLGMQERARAAGGTIEIDSAVSKGTEIRVRFPIGTRTD
jgi:signal transduction histidine kinase